MIPNQCEDQILTRYFKYFDLEGTGMASLRDFIKTIEKIGVVMGKIHDVSEVFNHYDSDANGSIDYKKFAVTLFSQEEKRNNKGYTSNTSIKNGNIKE
jgi:Ca2+-binding EF-hand superfamily protein